MNLAFETLKERLMHPPVVVFPSIADPFQIEKDFSSFTAGAVLSQKKADGKICILSIFQGEKYLVQNETIPLVRNRHYTLL